MLEANNNSSIQFQFDSITVPMHLKIPNKSQPRGNLDIRNKTKKSSALWEFLSCTIPFNTRDTENQVIGLLLACYSLSKVIYFEFFPLS